MKKVVFLSILSSLLAFFLFASFARANTETAEVSLQVSPISGSALYKNAYTPVNWSTQTKIFSGLGRNDIWPMVRANLQFPTSEEMTFNPSSKTTVCPDNKIGPNTSPGPVASMVNSCPRSVLGHGTAKFALNQSTNPLLLLDGYMVIFNGGATPLGAKIKVTAFSYETGAGVYTEGVLKSSGEIVFNIPRLTSDSSVTSLNLFIPGKAQRIYLENRDIYVNLPKGQDENYVQMKCANGSFPFSGDFLLGKRSDDGNVYESINVLASSSTPCAGDTGPAKLNISSFKGASSIKKGKRGKYSFTVKNAGALDAKNISLKVQGKGVSYNASLKNMMPATGQGVNAFLVFKKKGIIKLSFTLSGSNFKSTSYTKKVKVR